MRNWFGRVGFKVFRVQLAFYLFAIALSAMQLKAKQSLVPYLTLHVIQCYFTVRFSHFKTLIQISSRSHNIFQFELETVKYDKPNKRRYQKRDKSIRNGIYWKGFRILSVPCFVLKREILFFSLLLSKQKVSVIYLVLLMW